MLVYGLAIAVVLILIKIIWGSPLVTRVREGFANGGAPTNTTTECPPGSTMYMYNGQAYCCSTTINPDADSVQQTCRVPPVPIVGAPPVIFCTLGPPSKDVPNCMMLRSAQLQAEGGSICTTGMPTFVKGFPGSATAAGRCCVGTANSNYTDCADLTQAHCDVNPESNFFMTPNSCQFQRMGQDTTCPTGYGLTTVAGQNQFAGMTLVGCSDNGKICYPPNVMKALGGLNLDTSSLQNCATLQ